ncbi:MAG: ATP-binding cassette domain-containing protein, partial [Chloroflexi bacterium]|nr:ATP-binding cassette domain-containing protein [Chloroflexota bacterium]
THADILSMARKIGDGEWLETLPNGLETVVGERGTLLSMGQRQLVALLRVLMQKPAIFVLDEATASIDPFTEWQIQQALSMILAESTSILIAHRLSTVKAADRIIVIEKGRIIEEGSHDGLLQQCGQYATLYNTYLPPVPGVCGTGQRTGHKITTNRGGLRAASLWDKPPFAKHPRGAVASTP